MTARDDLIAIPDDLLRRGGIDCTILRQMDFRTNPQRRVGFWAKLAVAVKCSLPVEGP